MTKRVLFSILTLLLVLGLVACGGAPATEEATEASPDEPSEETVSLRVWAHQNEAFNAGYQALIDAYMAANPNVEITLETFEYDTYIQTLQTARLCPQWV